MSIALIQRKTAQHFAIELSDMLGKSRIRRFARPRHLAIAIAYEHTGKSLPEIARAFGRDHTSVLHAINGISGRLPRDRELSEAKAAIEAAIGLPVPEGMFRHRDYSQAVATVEPLP